MKSVRLDGRDKRTMEAQAVSRRGCRLERRRAKGSSKGKFEDGQIVDSNPSTGEINLDQDFYFPLIAHAILRTAHRDISIAAIEYVLLHGDWHWFPGWGSKGDRCEVTLSRRHILRSDRAEFGHLAGTIVIFEDPGTVITVMKQRAKETDVRQPYCRTREHWQRYLDGGMLN